MVLHSIRWRLLIWQGFLLVCLLAGFGLTAYQLHRTNIISDLDTELSRRVAALAADVRGKPPFLDGPGRPLRLGPDGTNRPFGPKERGRKEHRFEDFGPPPPGDFGPQPPGDFGPPFRRLPPPGGPGGPNFEDFLERREIRLSPATTGLLMESGVEEYYYMVWSRGGNALLRSTNAPAGMERPARGGLPNVVQAQMAGAARENYLYTEIGDCVLVGRSMIAEVAGIRRFAWLLVAVGSAVLVAGLGGGWLLAGRALRPVAEIGNAAGRISAGNLAERINVAETDSELGKLAQVLNTTFGRLENAFQQQRQFTADASHELRTPIAVIVAEAQSTLARERTAAEYRESLQICLEAAREMKGLAHSLLELAALDSGQPVEARQFDLGERVRAAVDMARSLAREKRIEVAADLDAVEVCGDPERLSRVVSNLLSNAVEYNRPGGKIHARLAREAGQALIEISDTGIGIAPEELPHVFDRFFRADKARTSRNGHTGLGLAIAKAIVQAHGGTIEALSQPGVGTTFRVRLPSGPQV